MAKPFRGVINVDVTQSVPDWEPYTQPIAPEGTPNVLYIVLDDVGYSATGPYGVPGRRASLPQGDDGSAELRDGAGNPAHGRSALMEPGDNDPLAAGLLLARSWQATVLKTSLSKEGEADLQEALHGSGAS
jgi:hypothetical protein